MRNLLLIILAVMTFTATAQDSIITKRTVRIIGSDTTGVIVITEYNTQSDTVVTPLVSNDTVVTPFVTNDTVGINISRKVDNNFSFCVSEYNYLRTLKLLQDGVPLSNNEVEFVELSSSSTKPVMIDGGKTLILYFKPN